MKEYFVGVFTIINDASKNVMMSFDNQNDAKFYCDKLNESFYKYMANEKRKKKYPIAPYHVEKTFAAVSVRFSNSLNFRNKFNIPYKSCKTELPSKNGRYSVLLLPFAEKNPNYEGRLFDEFDQPMDKNLFVHASKFTESVMCFKNGEWINTHFIENSFVVGWRKMRKIKFEMTDEELKYYGTMRHYSIKGDK